jgi:hypothetical protein
MSELVAALSLVLVVNLPFGWWREGLRKFSGGWLLAVHAPIPLIWVIRHLLGLPWRPQTLPLFLVAYFAGQWLGARARRARRG